MNNEESYSLVIQYTVENAGDCTGYGTMYHILEAVKALPGVSDVDFAELAFTSENKRGLRL